MVLILVGMLGIVSYAYSQASTLTPQPSMLDRMMNPNRQQKSPYQGKLLDLGGENFQKSFATGEYVGVKEFGSKSFLSKSFDGAKKNWLGQFFFYEKKLSENLQGVNPDATKQFASKGMSLKDYADLDKKSEFSTKEGFETRQIKPKGSSQGAIDNDQQLQETIKKGLSIDDVKKLLNKSQ